MYEDVVRRLRKIIKAHKEIYGGSTEESVAIEQAADAIDELDTLLDGVSADNDALCETIDRLKNPRWVSATERLPEKRKWVLCKCQANIVEVLRFENAEWYHDPAHVYMFEFVTHWMPLPEPPKEET